MNFKISITARNKLGQVRGVKIEDLPPHIASIIQLAQRKVNVAKPVYDHPPAPPAPKPIKPDAFTVKRGRGRPVGYRCSEATKRKMVEHRGRVYRGGDELHA